MATRLPVRRLDVPDGGHHFERIAFDLILDARPRPFRFGGHQSGHIISLDAHGFCRTAQHPAVLPDIQGCEVTPEEHEGDLQTLDLGDMEAPIIRTHTPHHFLKFQHGALDIEHHIGRKERPLHL